MISAVLHRFLFVPLLLAPSGRVLAIVVATSVALPAALEAQNAEMRLEVTPAVIHPGDSVQVEVFIDNPALEAIGGGELAIEFDRQAFALTAIETPDQIAGSLDPDLFIWNAPTPIGVGGITGCNQWWDGVDGEAISAVFALNVVSVEASSLLFRFELTAEGNAPIGDSLLVEPAVDLTCLWSGSFLVDNFGGVIPTQQVPAAVLISDVLEPTGLVCNSVGGDVQLSWTNGGPYETLDVLRDGSPLASLSVTDTTFTDATALLGATHTYTLIASSGGIESPPVTCSVTVDDSVPAPTGLACADVGGAVDLSWSLPAFPYDSIEVRRDGIVIATLAATATSTTDSGPPTGVQVTYAVRGVLGAVSSSPTSCTLTVAEPAGETFLRGDSNLDTTVNIADATFLLDYLFVDGSPEVLCLDGADMNDDGSANLADAIYLLGYLFSGGPPLPPPSEAPGIDPTPDSLGCAAAL